MFVAILAQALKSLLLSARLISQLPFVGHGFWSEHSEWTFGGCNLELAYHQPLPLSERHRCGSIGLISATTQLRFEWLHRHGTSVPQRDNVNFFEFSLALCHVYFQNNVCIVHHRCFTNNVDMRPMSLTSASHFADAPPELKQSHHFAKSRMPSELLLHKVRCRANVTLMHRNP